MPKLVHLNISYTNYPFKHKFILYSEFVILYFDMIKEYADFLNKIISELIYEI